MNWEQLRAILWLRWRLTRNQLARRGGWASALAIGGLAICGLAALAGGIAGVAGGVPLFQRAGADAVMLVWDGVAVVILFVWLMGLLSALQRSETIDLARLLHLPVRLQQIFFFNFLAGHLSLGMALLLPGLLGLAIAMVVVQGWIGLLILPALAGLVFMVSGWAYCLRGWLVTLMVNPRRRRTVIVVATAVVVLFCQVPNVVIQMTVNRRGLHAVPVAGTAPVPSPAKFEVPPILQTIQPFVPPFWLAWGARGLATGNPWPALFASLGGFTLGAWGLRRAYRATLRFYRGDEPAVASARPANKQAARPARLPSRLLEWRLPGLAEETSALTLAFFRSLSRAPEVRLALVMNFIIVLVMLGVFLRPQRGAPPDFLMPFIATGVVLLPLFGMAQLLFNQFGFDRDGFRLLLLLPVRHRQMLVAKNLAAAPLAAAVAGVLLLVLFLLVRVPALHILAAAVQFVNAYLLVSLAGNALSVLAPYRIAPGSLKPTKVPPGTILLIAVSNLLFPVLMLPAFVPAGISVLADQLGWGHGGFLMLLGALAEVAVLLPLYVFSLPAYGRLLHARAPRILQAVTEATE